MHQDFSKLQPIETVRLQLREPHELDRETIFFMRTNPEVNQYIKRTPPTSLQEIDTFIKDRLKDRNTSTAIYWVLALKAFPNTCIGAISLWQFSEDRKTAEVGYDLHPDYQGKGYMSEALKIVLEFGFQSLDLDTIEAYTHLENKPSRALLEKHAFKLTDKIDTGLPMNVVYTISR